jgi:quercetin dioxygenase-like cupin family protein
MAHAGAKHRLLAIGPVTVGFGFGLAALWAIRTPIVHSWLAKLRERPQQLTTHVGFKAISAHEVDWSRNQLNQHVVTYFMKPQFQHPKTGEVTMLIRYPAGQMNPSHVHPVGHGMYVLQGSLVTHRGTFGPHTFVWFPPNEVMHHGAGPEEDLLALFTVGRDFRTDYAQRER